VSNIVREMCVGKEFSFSKKGDYDLKGFPEPVPIYLAEWQSPASLSAGEAQPGARISNS
jgi:class 3 adenylate cyclase